MTARVRQLALCATLLAACTPASARSEAARDEGTVPAQLHVTHGALRFAQDGSAEVTSPSVRAELTAGPSERAELRFTYLGPSERPEPLASGEVRQQLGLKLRARDSCNVVYAMWRLSAPPTLSVSVKANLAATQHADCGDRGYATVAPTVVAPLPEVRAGEPHALVAVLGADRLLRVYADEKVVWSGTLPEVAFAFDGPAGLRTDNVKAKLVFHAGARVAGREAPRAR